MTLLALCFIPVSAPASAALQPGEVEYLRFRTDSIRQRYGSRRVKPYGEKRTMSGEPARAAALCASWARGTRPVLRQPCYGTRLATRLVNRGDAPGRFTLCGRGNKHFATCSGWHPAFTIEDSIVCHPCRCHRIRSRRSEVIFQIIRDCPIDTWRSPKAAANNNNRHWKYP